MPAGAKPSARALGPGLGPTADVERQVIHLEILLVRLDPPPDGHFGLMDALRIAGEKVVPGGQRFALEAKPIGAAWRKP